MANREPQFPERFGPFVLLRELGVGGMGTAYLAMHVESGDMLVVKRMHPELLAEKAIFKRFVHEAEVATHVRHPNVAALVAMGTIDQEPFLATEYVFGIQVSQIVDRIESSQIDPIPIHIGLILVTDLVKGVASIHSARHRETGEPLALIHRDIGSRNVLVGFDGQVRIIDLGLGKSILSDWHTAAQVLAGSPDYMPPEQAMGARVDGRADVYSASVTAWEIIAGRKRIREEGVAARLARAIQATPEPLLVHRPDAPKRLEAILKQGMHPDPELRTPTANILEKALVEELKERARGVTRQDVIAWLDSACATVIAKEKRTLAEVRAQGMAFVGRGSSAAKTEMLVGRPGGFELPTPYDFYDADTAPPVERGDPSDPAIWSKLGTDARANVEMLASSSSVAALAGLVDPQNFKTHPPYVRILLVAGAMFVLVLIATLTALIMLRPDAEVQVSALPEPIVETPKPPPAKVPREPVVAVETKPIEEKPIEVEKVAPVEETKVVPPVEPVRAMSPEAESRKSDLVRRIRQLRRMRFDVDFQRRLTTLSTRLSRARSMKALDEVEGTLIRMEAER